MFVVTPFNQLPHTYTHRIGARKSVCQKLSHLCRLVLFLLAYCEDVKMKTLTTEEKLNFIAEVEKGRNKRELADKYGISYASACRIANKKSALLARGLSAFKQMRQKKLKFPKTDQAMDVWFAAMREKCAASRHLFFWKIVHVKVTNRTIFVSSS